MGKGAAGFQKNVLCDNLWCLSCLIQRAPHLWSGKCYPVDYLFFVALGRWKFQAPGWDVKERMKRPFFKNIRKKKKSWFLSPAVWLLHNLVQKSAFTSLPYVPLRNLSHFLTTSSWLFGDSHFRQQDMPMDCAEKRSADVFLEWAFGIYVVEEKTVLSLFAALQHKCFGQHFLWCTHFSFHLHFLALHWLFKIVIILAKKPHPD